MIILGLLSLVQVLLLPGLIITSRLNSLSWTDRVLLAFPLSLVLNHLLVVGLVLVGQYQQSVVLAIFLCEVVALAACAYFARPVERASSPGLDPWLFWSDSFGVIIAKVLLTLALLLSALILVTVFNQQIGTVFLDWDAVVSWNRWAVDWFHQAFPAATASYPYGTYTYPQLLPTLYSLTYAFIGDYRVEQFAKLVAAAFPLASLFTFLRLAELLKNGRVAVYAGVIIFFGFFPFYGDVFQAGYQFSGYADMPLAYFCLAAIYGFLLVSGCKGQNSGHSTWLIIWTCVIAAGAAMVKQNGLLITLGYPLALYYYGRDKHAYAKRMLVTMLVLVILLAIPWYVYKLAEIIDLHDSVIWSAYSDPIHHVPWYARPLYGLRQLFSPIGWWWLALFMVGLLDRNGRRFALWVVLPFYCFWALILSYDLRNIAPALPAMALVMGYGVQLIYQRINIPILLVAVLVFICGNLMQKLALTLTWTAPIVLTILTFCLWQLALHHHAVRAVPQRAAAVSQSMSLLVPILLIITIGVSLPTKTTGLLAQAIAKKSVIGEPGVNDFLRDFLAKHPDSGQVGTSYQLMGFMPGIAGRFQLVQCSTKQQYLSGFALDRVKYLLTGPWCPKDVQDFMMRGVERGAFHLLFDQSGFRFYDMGNGDVINLLRTSWRIGRDSLGGESLYSATNLPLRVASGNGGFIESVNGERGGIAISGWTASSQVALSSDWLLVLIGDRLVSLTEVGEDRPDVEERLGSYQARVSGFTVRLPTTLLQNGEGTVRLFGLRAGILNELQVPDAVRLTGDLADMGIEVRTGQLYLHHSGRIIMPN